MKYIVYILIHVSYARNFILQVWLRKIVFKKYQIVINMLLINKDINYVLNVLIKNIIILIKKYAKMEVFKIANRIQIVVNAKNVIMGIILVVINA